jgi:uncharacterized membrane protein YagU involved in acid resistance
VVERLKTSQFRYGVAGAIISGGALAAALEILPALIVHGYLGVSPTRVFQAIASGLSGNAVYRGGISSALLGGAIHLGISIAFAAVFVLVSRRFIALARRWILAGIAYGAVAYAVMNWIVVALSAAAFKAQDSWLLLTMSIATHLFFFGLPIAWCARVANSSFLTTK